ncbi:MAG: hypothetical protein LC793_15675 [Thermomicrobia bacterium]|nr:hypothetical protein [Thermomicrobia bacterium]
MKLLPTLLLDLFFIALGLIPLVFLLSVVIRRSRRVALGIVAIPLAIVAFVGLLVAQPTLRADYLASQDAASNTLVLTRGVYPAESDSAGNRFVWTQDHVTFLLSALPHTPITITFMMRSAAVAGGPNVPVQVEVNGVAVGQLQPDPTNANFQPITLRFVPYDWGGQQTEIKLVATTFRPGKGDGRILGTMIQGVSVDLREAWLGVSKGRWLIGMLPICAVIAAVAAEFGRRRDSAPGRSVAVVASVVGSVCAFGITFLVMRNGVITPQIYQVWVLAAAYLGALFLLAAILLPLGVGEAHSLANRAVAWLARRPIAGRVRARVVAFRGYINEESPTGARRRAIARDLRFVFIVALGIRLIWAVLLPPWMGIDETEHFAYVNHIVEQRRLPGVPVASLRFRDGADLHRVRHRSL